MRWVAVVLAPLLIGAAWHSYIIKLDDTMSSFWQSVASIPGQPMAQRVEAFKQTVVLPNLGFYANGEFAGDLDDASIAAYLTRIDSEAPALRTLSDRVAQKVMLDVAMTVRALPGLSLDGVKIAVLPSFGHFDAQTHDIPGGTGVFFAPDGMLQSDGPDANIAVYVAHELFHVYQFQTHPGYDTSELQLWQAVWGEGSAAYASQQIAARATRAQALGATLAATSPESTAQLACFVSSHWSSRNQDDIADMIDSGAHVAHLPPRGGYLIGYLAAQDFARNHTVAHIGSAPASEVEPAMRATVARLCGR